ncbi:hypothetical protein HDU82_006605 [Entophlyctis luteolus]|nr:hypothetical protein HDU82_006605 [Entophlyctis luteolus]
MKRIMSWLRLAFALAATALYGVTIAPLQTIVTIASADAETRDYFAHVGLRAHLGCLMIRFPTSALRIPWHSPIIRALFRLVAIVERKFFVARGTRIVDSTDERVKGIWTQSDEENRARALSSHVLMYIHGGGFVTGHPGFYTGMASTMVAKFNERMKLSGETLAIFCPEYPLCPENSFDEILASLVDSYKMLVALGYTKISIAGDSAGGNAALNLVSILSMDYGYLLQPYSAVIFSPWVDPFVTYLPPEPCPFDIMTVQDSRRRITGMSGCAKKKKNKTEGPIHEFGLNFCTEMANVTAFGYELATAGNITLWVNISHNYTSAYVQQNASVLFSTNGTRLCEATGITTENSTLVMQCGGVTLNQTTNQTLEANVTVGSSSWILMDRIVLPATVEPSREASMNATNTRETADGAATSSSSVTARSNMAQVPNMTAFMEMVAMTEMEVATSTVNGSLTETTIPISALAIATIGGLTVMSAFVTWLAFRQKKSRERRFHSGDSLEWVSHGYSTEELRLGALDDRISLDEDRLMDKIVNTNKMTPLSSA